MISHAEIERVSSTRRTLSKRTLTGLVEVLPPLHPATHHLKLHENEDLFVFSLTGRDDLTHLRRVRPGWFVWITEPEHADAVLRFLERTTPVRTFPSPIPTESVRRYVS
ncbi:MAG: hypothetical protein KGI41_00415 [Patescibacteria group bacterium]|nr:hypothetical protein [Patescibacteria group bacterium]MDE1965693.1 hypothetical protein [Patescibacteria group bacterium]